MNALHEHASVVPNESYSQDADLAAGQAELASFECARAAYRPGDAVSEQAMLAAFHRFHRMGYEAYFSGATVIPDLLAAQPMVTSMWMVGYHVAQSEALGMTCHCDCPRKYVWGKGYDPCPRRATAASIRISVIGCSRD